MKTLGDVGAGHTLGRYELLVPIAQGGMAVVWAARMKGSRGFSKTVAVKCMLPALTDDPQFEEMFLAEAELASRIKHPHVCEILDLGEQEGILYIVMEWVDGEPLSTLQKAARLKGGIPLSVAARIVLNAAAGLHAAHELKTESGELVGLVHRDVSPQNILVTYDGVVKIVDFGVAKATSQADNSHTKAGQVKGKIPFMSPEQALGKNVDRRTDIFALGIVLYQMLTGKHPFRGENDMATLHKICEKVPVTPVKASVPDCPQSLSDAIAQALDKNVEKRFATMQEFARALEKCVAEMTAGGKDEDLGAFVRKTLGERAEKRRTAIKEALRVADERTKNQGLTGTGQFAAVSMPQSSEISIASSLNPPISGVTAATSVAAGTASSPTGQSSAAFVLPPAATKNGKGKMIAIAAGGALVVALGTFLALRGSGAKAGAQPVPSASSVVVATASAEPPPAASAEPSKPPRMLINGEEVEATPVTSSATPSASASAKVKPGHGPGPGTGPKPKASAVPNDGPKVSNPGF